MTKKTTTKKAATKKSATKDKTAFNIGMPQMAFLHVTVGSPKGVPGMILHRKGDLVLESIRLRALTDDSAEGKRIKKEAARQARNPEKEYQDCFYHCKNSTQ